MELLQFNKYLDKNNSTSKVVAEDLLGLLEKKDEE